MLLRYRIGRCLEAVAAPVRRLLPHHAHREIDMVNGPVFSNVLRYSIPLILSGMLQLLYNIADVIVVGKFENPAAVASVTATSSLITLMVNLFIGLSVGHERAGGAVHRRGQVPRGAGYGAYLRRPQSGDGRAGGGVWPHYVAHFSGVDGHAEGRGAGRRFAVHAPSTSRHAGQHALQLRRPPSCARWATPSARCTICRWRASSTSFSTSSPSPPLAWAWQAWRWLPSSPSTYRRRW